MTENGERKTPVRLDTWLWCARFFKTRALAAAAVDGGKVEVNGVRAKRAKPLKVGDRLRLRKGPFVYQLAVRGLSARRGPVAAAATLYEEDATTKAQRERLAEQLRIAPSVQYEGKGRPTKKQRRDLDRLTDG
jgi:ribosome-associated heat shock protein Hsp15